MTYLPEMNKMLQVKVSDLEKEEKELDRLWLDYGIETDKELENNILKRLKGEYNNAVDYGFPNGRVDYYTQYAKVTEMRLDLAKFLITAYHEGSALELVKANYLHQSEN